MTNMSKSLKSDSLLKVRHKAQEGGGGESWNKLKCHISSPLKCNVGCLFSASFGHRKTLNALLTIFTLLSFHQNSITAKDCTDRLITKTKLSFYRFSFTFCISNQNHLKLHEEMPDYYMAIMYDAHCFGLPVFRFKGDAC